MSESNNKKNNRRIIFLLFSLIQPFIIPTIIGIGIFSLAITIYSSFLSMGGGMNLKKDEFNTINNIKNNSTFLGGFENDRPSGLPITGQGQLRYTLDDHMNGKWRTAALKSVAIDIHEFKGSESDVKRTIEGIMSGKYENTGSKSSGEIGEITGNIVEGENERVKWLNEKYKEYKSDWDFSYFKNFKNGRGTSANVCVQGKCRTYTDTFTDPFYFYSTISGEVFTINQGSACLGVRGKEYIIGFCHYNELNVNVGDKVGAGQILGTMGMRGFTTGTHMHYEIGKHGKMGFYKFLGNSNSSKGVEMLNEVDFLELLFEGKIVKGSAGGVGDMNTLYYFDHVGSSVQCLVDPDSCGGSHQFGGELGDFIDGKIEDMLSQGFSKSLIYTILESEGVSKDRSGGFDIYKVAPDGGVGLFQIQEPAGEDGFPSQKMKNQYKEFEGTVSGTPTVIGSQAALTAYKGLGCNQGYKLRKDKGPGSVFFNGSVYGKNTRSLVDKDEVKSIGCDLENDYRFNPDKNYEYMIKELYDKIHTCKGLLGNKKMSGGVPSGIDVSQGSYAFDLCVVIAYNGITPTTQKIFFSSHMNHIKDIENNTKTQYNYCMNNLSSTLHGNCRYARLYAEYKYKEAAGKLDSYFTTNSFVGVGDKLGKLKDKVEESINGILNKEQNEKKDGYDFHTDESITKFVGTKNSFTNKQYKPKLVDIKDTEYVSTRQSDSKKGRKEAIDALNNMAKDFYSSNKEKINVYSSYRSYERQTEIAKGCDPTWCARGGHSEHQSGLSFDFWSIEPENWKTEKFKKRYEWLDKNAHKYGYTQSYKNGVSVEGYQIEQWHWRYIGIKLATELKEKNMTFTQYFNSMNK